MKLEQNSKKKLILPIFLASIMVLSIFGGFLGLSGGDKEDNLKFKMGNSEFVFQDGVYKGRKENLNFYVTSDPRKLSENVPVIANQILGNEKVYLSYNPKEGTQLPVKIIYENLKQHINIFLACSVDIEECKDLPIKTCDDAKDKVGVFLVEFGEKNIIDVKDQCVILNGNLESLNRMSNAIILQLFGVNNG